MSTSAFGPPRVVFLFHVTVSREQAGFYELGEWLMGPSEDGIVLTHAAWTAINQLNLTDTHKSVLHNKFNFLKSSPEDVFIDFRERLRERERDR